MMKEIRQLLREREEEMRTEWNLKKYTSMKIDRLLSDFREN